MKENWQRIVMKLDAMSLRERIMIFVAAMAVLILFVMTVFLEPLLAKQKKLASQLRQAQGEIAGTQTEIAQKLQLYSVDPDQANRARLQQLTLQMNQKRDALHTRQQNLVAPDKVAALLENVLKQNGKLRLLSLKTIASTSLTDSAANAKDAKESADGKAPATPISAPAEGPVFRHGFEIIVQGGYLDLVDYLTELEKLPWQLYWGKVQLEVDDYPKATLTINVFTLSLDRKWLNL